MQQRRYAGFKKKKRYSCTKFVRSKILSNYGSVWIFYQRLRGAVEPRPILHTGTAAALFPSIDSTSLVSPGTLTQLMDSQRSGLSLLTFFSQGLGVSAEGKIIKLSFHTVTAKDKVERYISVVLQIKVFIVNL